MKLHDKLRQLNTYPFHMPGHKRNPVFGIAGAEIDITEIDGFDNLHRPEGVLAELQAQLARIYHAEHSFLSVGGSTLGMLCAILALTRRGDTIIIARNCHKSVYNACLMNELQVVYLTPEFDSINGCYTSVMQDRLDAAVAAHPEAKAVVITSPTYEGRLSNVTCPLPLIVDAAHGAHLGLADFPAYPRGSIVVSSLHKTLPALTQTAVINVYDPTLTEKVRRWVNILETSSPSYVLMNSVSICCDVVLQHPEAFSAYYRRLSDFRTLPLENLRLKYSHDISKIVISTENTDLTGSQLASILRDEYGIEAEMASRNYIVLMTSVGDEQAAFLTLENALLSIDRNVSLQENAPLKKPPVPQGITRLYYPEETAAVPLRLAVGKTAAEFIYAYPPDIPILAPGETVTQAAAEYLKEQYDSGVTVISDSGGFPNSILTKADESTII